MPSLDATHSGPPTLALAGLAGYGESYLKAILADAGRRVRLVAGIDPRAQASEFHAELIARGVPIFPSLDAMWASGQPAPEIVALATPIHLHRIQTVDALAHGCHVICEKPLAGDVVEALAMRDAAARRPDLVVAIGYQWSFSAAVQAFKRDALAGRFGAARRFRTLLTMPRPLDYFRRNRWAGRCRADDGSPVFDSPANNAAAHHLHNMLYVGGSAIDRAATPVRVTAELARANDIENYDTAAIRVETREGVEILFYTSHATTAKLGPLATFEFDRATVRFDPDGDGRIRAELSDGERVDYGNPDDDRFAKLWQIAAAVRDPSRRPVVCGIDAALPHAQVIAAAQRSMSIAAVAAPFAGEVDHAGERFRIIRDADVSLAEACTRGVLPGEANLAPWLGAVSARPVDVEPIESRPAPRAATSLASHFEGAI